MLPTPNALVVAAALPSKCCDLQVLWLCAAQQLLVQQRMHVLLCGDYPLDTPPPPNNRPCPELPKGWQLQQCVKCTDLLSAVSQLLLVQQRMHALLCGDYPWTPPPPRIPAISLVM
jgi:hypothetical protein